MRRYYALIVTLSWALLLGSAGVLYAQSSPELTRGTRVEVKSGGKWYPAVVVEVGKDGPYAGLPRVHYDGYGEEFDEFVNLDRIRPLPPSEPVADKEGGRPASSSTSAATSPLGRYVCQAFEAGQIQVQGEFVLESGGVYRETMFKKNGTWKYASSSRALKFTGVLSNGAKATFYPDMYRGRRRKGVIAFDWGNGVVRECYRQ